MKFGFKALLLSSVSWLGCAGADAGEVGSDFTLQEAVATAEQDIVGGLGAERGEFPWQASIATTTHFCGGSLISLRWVLTTADCMEGQTPTRLRVRLGSLRRSSGGQLLTVKRIVRHPRYEAGPGLVKDYNIALVELAELPLPSLDVLPIALQRAAPQPGERYVISGWGTTSQGSGSLPANLNKTTLGYISPDRCEETYPDLTPRHMCIGINGGGKGTCQGDQGGPVVRLGLIPTLVGIQTNETRCAQAGYPDVPIRVSALTGWIDSVVGLPL